MVCTIDQAVSEAGHPSKSAVNWSMLVTDVTWPSDRELSLSFCLP